MPHNVDNNQTALAIPAIFRLAFRPLFLGGVFFSVIAMSWWVYFWANPFQWQPYGGVIWWHSHEMLFGFGIAIVTGFLLTAVKTWTGVAGLRGALLAGLFFIWLAGRLLISFGQNLPAGLVASVDVSYLVFAAIAMAYPVIQVKQWRNLIFVPILLVLGFLNAASHYAVQTDQPLIALQTIHATIMLFVLIISILGGRVIPAFTANGTGTTKSQPLLWLEATAIASVIVLVIIAYIGFENVPQQLLFSIASFAAVVNGLRFARWGIQHSLKTPLLWSLHFSFMFIPIGFVLLALYALGVIDNLSAVLHSFTVGAMGGMNLAMTSRVTLGHTGRPLKPNKLMSLAFMCILVAALVRIFSPLLFIEHYALSISLSGFLWVIAFALFLVFYTSMLVTPRADGRPG